MRTSPASLLLPFCLSPCLQAQTDPSLEMAGYAPDGSNWTNSVPWTGGVMFNDTVSHVAFRYTAPTEEIVMFFVDFSLYPDQSSPRAMMAAAGAMNTYPFLTKDPQFSTGDFASIVYPNSTTPVCDVVFGSQLGIPPGEIAADIRDLYETHPDDPDWYGLPGQESPTVMVPDDSWSSTLAIENQDRRAFGCSDWTEVEPGVMAVNATSLARKALWQQALRYYNATSQDLPETLAGNLADLLRTQIGFQMVVQAVILPPPVTGSPPTATRHIKLPQPMIIRKHTFQNDPHYNTYGPSTWVPSITTADTRIYFGCPGIMAMVEFPDPHPNVVAWVLTTGGYVPCTNAVPVEPPSGPFLIDYHFMTFVLPANAIDGFAFFQDTNTQGYIDVVGHLDHGALMNVFTLPD
ncbi:MAG TPA: hypothetical protein VFZ65_18500 [Planctomycetota bacterium]|nr:hypothetical protein [Planctomycetota bacterium]